MKTYTIPQKMSGTGTIHDLANDMCDREIKLPKGAIYAVVLASYYGGKGYTTHKTEAAAIKQSRDVRGYSHKIIDCNGQEYIDHYGELIRA